MFDNDREYQFNKYFDDYHNDYDVNFSSIDGWKQRYSLAGQNLVNL